MQAAEGRLSRLAERARSRHDDTVASRLRIMLYTNWDRSDRAIEVFLEWLRRGGTDWSVHPTREDAMREYDRIWTQLGSRQIEDIVGSPLITDPEVLDTLDVFSEAVTPSFFSDENLSSLVVCRLVSLSLEHGNCDASCYGYVFMAFLAGRASATTGTDFGSASSDMTWSRNAA